MNTILLAAGLFLGADPEPKLPKMETPKELKPLAFLIGTWKGEGEMPGFGKYEDEFVYTWNNEFKTFIKIDYAMKAKGQTVWKDETVIGYDPDLNKIVSFTFGMDGSIGRGVVGDSKENEWTIEGKSVGGTPFKEWKMTLRKKGEDLEVEVVTKQDEKWSPMMTTKYKKVAPKK